ncbi:MAG: type I pantothenate kinase [Acetilactobacillus jinshanensis]
MPITDKSLQQIKAFNDRISLQDVQDIYIPLVHLLRMRMDNFKTWHDTRAMFLQRPAQRTPFIIGISGSVAVGKSTTARLLEVLLSHFFEGYKVQMITTDGFLYPNRVLKKKHLMKIKGFPQTYDMPALIKFLNAVKTCKREVKSPVYSHQVYDVIPHRYDIVDRPDVLIIEGINVLQLPSNQQLYVSDFTDFSIYIDAKAPLIEQWYLTRLKKLMKTAFQDPSNYYYHYAHSEPEAVIKMAKRVWDQNDLPNLKENILPTRSRADFIIHKTHHHRIDKVYLRKY